jgi:nickel/cobalt exporter
VLVLVIVCALLALAAIDLVFAQGSPFGGGPRPLPPESGMMGWIFAKQAEFYRMLSGSIRAAKADGSAVAGLFGISCLYGIFHAAGPGHGKAVISSYLVANDETWRRGVLLSFASAIMQALVAIALVAVASIALRATAKNMSDAVRIIEIASYAMIIAIGARLLWIKGRSFADAWRGRGDHHGHHHHDHHVHDASCDHAHGPEPKELAGPGGWRRGVSAVVAVGARPCSGAIIVLVFALAQGLFWAGVGATFIMGLGTALTVAAIATLAVAARSFAGRIAKTRAGSATLALRGIEVGAAVVVVVFGVMLLTGYMASERLMGI